LDAAIRDAALEPRGKQEMMWRPGALADFDVFLHPNGAVHHALEYTGYFDAATALIPANCVLDHVCEHWRVEGDAAIKTGGATVKLATGRAGKLHKFQAEGATPAIALTACCLKALASFRTQEQET
jgi:hypothetical protein